jgi:hypothetical protein
MRYIVRRFHILPALVVTAVIGGSAAVAAQDSRSQQKRTVVIPQEVIIELQRLAHETFGDEAFKDLSREITRAMQHLGRELGHVSGPGFHAGPAMQNKDFKFEQTDRQTKTLAIGANGTLELQNIVGDITVKAGGSREATVEIVRVSRGRTEADAKLGLERVTAEVTSRGSRATVTAEYPNERRPDFSVSVAYNVTAPADARVLVQTITGNVTLTGIKGETSVNTTTGAVEIAQAADLTSAHTVTGKLVIRDSQGDALDIGTMNGPIHLTNIKTRRLELSAVTGDIIAREIQAGGVDATCMSCQIEYSGPVTAGGRYEFQAHSGSIRLGLTGGFDFEGETFSGVVEADPSLGLKPVPQAEPAGLGMKRKSLKGMVGGGGAFVEATTFSGSVKVGRSVPEATPRKGRGGE